MLLISGKKNQRAQKEIYLQPRQQEKEESQVIVGTADTKLPGNNMFDAFWDLAVVWHWEPLGRECGKSLSSISRGMGATAILARQGVPRQQLQQKFVSTLNDY